MQFALECPQRCRVLLGMSKTYMGLDEETAPTIKPSTLDKGQ